MIPFYLSRKCSSLLKVYAATCLSLLFAVANADSLEKIAPVRADTYAPIGVMGEHMHNKDEWMVSYRFMRMEMDGVQDGQSKIAPPDVGSMVVPLDMTMDMHMFGAMYAPGDSLTLMAMINYLDNSMISAGGMGTTPVFETETSGLGDAYLGGMYRLYTNDKQHWHLNLGVTAPTGSIDETVATPMGTTRAPYAMQLGSGTWDVKPGLTYTGRSNTVTWGAQYMGTLRLGTNDEGYTLGDQHQLTAWTAYSQRPWWSYSLRVTYLYAEDIAGQDPSITAPPLASPVADPANYGGQSVFGYFGLNFAGQNGFLRGQRIALEFGAPITQDLNGPQLAADYSVSLGWQYAF
jgi:hypothetical protein